MSVVRYNFVNDYHYCGCGEVEDDNGEYVEYADYQKLLNENAKLRAAIERVQVLHRPTLEGAHCMVCHSSDSSDWDFYPCPTLRAIDGEDA